MERCRQFIDGEFVDPRNGRWLDDIAPGTGKACAEVAAGDAADVDAAVAAATRAQEAWGATPARERARVLRAIGDGIEARGEELARVESEDCGKPISLARRMDVPRSAENLRFFAGAIEHWASECHDMDGAALNYTLRRPLGVVGLISPWNLPLYLFTWKVGPALAAGCAAVGKPSEMTPRTATLLCEIAREAGLSSGVLNVVHGRGSEAGAALVAHPGVRAVSFTGGTSTGREIARECAGAFKKASLELGGKNPNVVFADADMDEAVETGVRASFTNSGQICLCGSRIFVERGAYEGFVARFVERAKRLRVGDPSEESTEIGSVISREHMEKVLGFVESAREDGGEVRLGGGRAKVGGACAGGFFVEPTVITGLGASCRVMQEEVFGPVVTISPFEHEEEAIALANGVRYGLASMVWTRDVARAHRVASRIQSGVVWVNCWLLRDLRTPFGGMKESGMGREGGWEALRFFTEPKNVCVKVR